MQVGEYGDRIPMQTDLDLASATSGAISITVERPDGSAVTHVVADADIGQPASLGLLYYTIVQGDLTMDGIYTLQAIDATSGRSVRTVPIEVYVHPNI